MAGETRKLTVSVSPAALAALDEIWHWNAGKYGADHADGYVAFLLEQTNRLTSDFFKGRAVLGIPHLSYIVIRKRRRGHGHVAVYELIRNVIYVLHFYHTAQDWQTKLTNE